MRNRVKEVDGSLKEAHARPVNMSTLLTITTLTTPVNIECILQAVLLSAGLSWDVCV